MSQAPHPRVRPATKADAKRICDLFFASRAQVLPNGRLPLGEAETRAYLTGLIDKPDYTFWVAVRDDDVLGFLVLREDWVDHLYVRPDWFRRGIGTMLLDRAKRASPQGLRLFCFQCNQRARSFYTSRGLVPMRFSDGAANPEREPDLEFFWRGSAPDQNRSSP